jgi:hypothetical protein
MVLPRAVPSGMDPSERKDPRLVKPIPREGRRSGRHPPASSDGSDHRDSDSLQRRQSRGRSLDSASTPSAPSVAEPSAAPRRLAVFAYLGRRSPGCSCVPCHRRGPRFDPGYRGGRGVSPRANGGGGCSRLGAAGRSGAAPQDGGPEVHSPRAGRLEARSPQAGLVGSSGEESLGALQDVRLRLQLFFVVILPTCLLTLPSVFL